MDERRRREDRENREHSQLRRHRSERQARVERDDHRAERRRFSQRLDSDLHHQDQGQLSPSWYIIPPGFRGERHDHGLGPLDPVSQRDSAIYDDDLFYAQALAQAEMEAQCKPKSGQLPAANRRSVTIDSDVVYVSEPSYTDITSPPPTHIAPGRSRSFRSGPHASGHDGSKPLPVPPHPQGPNGSSPLDPELQPPYWMETIGHAIWTLGLTLGHIFGSFATSILIFILGSFHCIMTSVLLVVGAVFDGLTTMLRIFFNLITCHFASGEWGWEWTHLTRAWQWGRKSQWVWQCVGRVNTESGEREEKIAKRVSLHEARKEEYKREQEEKALEQGQTQVAPANKRFGNGILYGQRPMVVDVEKGLGRGPEQASGNRVSDQLFVPASALTSQPPYY
jgi:hypothetical protein